MAVKKLVRKVAPKHAKSVASRAGATINISTRTGKPTRKYTKRNVGTTLSTIEAPTTKKISKKKNVVTSVKKPTTKKSNITKIKAAPRERNFDSLTGFVVGSDQHVIAEALLAGGETRGDITDALRKKLSPTTKSGTVKPVANIVSSVFNKLVSNGFILESQFRLLPPTPASKRKATRIKNKSAQSA